MTPSARIQAAIELLSAIASDPRPADAVASGFFRARRFIGATDRRAVGETVWSVLRARRRLGWWLARAGGAEMPQTARLLALASLVLGGTRAERAAALFDGARFGPAPVEAAERRVLAALDRHTLEHPEMPEAVRLEIPDFVLPHFQARFGGRLEAECAAMSRPAPLDLRVNLLKTTREAALAALAGEGFDAAPTPLSPWGLRLAPRQNIVQAAAFREGLVEIQDEGSQLVALIAGARPGMRVLDYCAGAAGKTLALAMEMGNRGHIVACDVSAPRLEAATKRLRRAGIHNAERHLLVPGDKWPKRHEAGFDRVLVDAPCTGTGTWRRNPDARLRLTERDLAELTVRQAEILDRASRLVKPGGMLVYATCSLLEPENEAQIAAFLERAPGFRIASEDATPGDAPAAALPARLQGGMLTLWPGRDGTDGFFACRLIRDAARQ